MRWGMSRILGGPCWQWTHRQFMDGETLLEVDRAADALMEMICERHGVSEAVARRTVEDIANGRRP